LNGAQNLQDNSGGLEGQIDIQYTVGVAGNVPTTYLLDQSNNDAAISYMVRAPLIFPSITED
jgi:tripeptidyl-peptidase-1